MSTILVTGGAGFIGSNFVRYWKVAHPDDEIIVFDKMGHGSNVNNLIEGVGFWRGDICVSWAFPVADIIVHFAGIRAFPSTIVHFAAESHVDRSITGPEAFTQSNVVGTQRLLDFALQHGCRFHHISTDEVYGSLGPDDPPFTEKSPYDPRSPYAATKAASDHLVRAYAHTYGLPVTITSCCNNYGPYQNIEKFIPLMITNAIQGKPLPVYGDGGNVREWLYVEDHCRAIDLVLCDGSLGETYNVGSGIEMTNLELAQFICDTLKEPRDLITFVEDRLGHDKRYLTDFSKLAKLGYKPEISWFKGIANTIQWYKKNEAWWR